MNLLHTFSVAEAPNTIFEVYWDGTAFLVGYKGAPAPDTIVFTGAVDQMLPFGYCVGRTRVKFFTQKAYPYAYKTETENAFECAIHVCDLEIKKPVKKTDATAAGAADGSITVELVGFAQAPRYSLDNVTFQVSNVFTGLVPGTYTVYVRDQDGRYPPSEWCRAQTNVKIGFPAGFGPRYQLDFDNILTGAAHRNYSLQVFKKDYSGPVDFVCASEDTVIELEWNEGEHKFDGWKPSKGLFSFYAEELYSFDELYTADERGYRVDLREGGNLEWRGYLLPEFLSHPFQDGLYFVSLTAADGLATLKNYLYLDKDDNEFTGERSFIDIIFDCLDKLDLGIQLVTAIDLYADGMRETADVNDKNPLISDPLFQASVNTDWFRDEKGLWDCEQVLKKVVGTFKARISQWGGKWVVEAIDAKTGPYWTVIYNPDRTFAGYQVIDPVQTRRLPNTGFPQWVREVPNHDFIPAAKEITVENDLLVVENLIKGGNFRNRDFINNTNLKDWVGLAPIERFAVNEKEDKNAVIFQARDVYGGGAEYQQSEPFHITGDAGAQLYLRLDYFVDGNPSEDSPAEIYLKLESADHSLKNADVNSTRAIWQSGLNSNLSSVFYKIRVTQGNSVQSFELITPPVLFTGNYYLRIYELAVQGPNTTIVRYHGITVSMLPGGRKPLEYQESTITNPKFYSWVPDPFDVHFTDVPEPVNYKATYKNYIAVAGKATNGWHFKGEPESNNLLNILAANIAASYARPSRVLKGTLQGLFRYGHILKEPSAGNRLFYPDGLRVDYRMAEASGSFVEIIGSVGAENPGGEPGPGEPTNPDSIVINAVTVTGNTITVTAATIPAGLAVVYTINGGDTYQNSNIFEGVANGTYSPPSIQARIKGTDIVAVWTGTVVINYVVMQPKPAAPTGWVTDDAANTGDWTDNPLFPAGEMMIAGQVRTIISKPIINILGDHAVGTVGVRIAATATRPASDWLFNGVAYTDGGAVIIDPKDLTNYVKYIDLLGELPVTPPDPKTAPNMPLFMQYLGVGGGGLDKGTIKLEIRRGGVATTVFEKGTTAAIEARAEITPNDETNITGRRISKAGQVWEFTTGLIFTANDNVNAQTAYSAEFTGTVSGTRTATATIFPVAPSYHGVVNSPAPTENEVKGLTKQIWPKRDRLIGFNAINQRATFAEPASFGIRSIYDQNGFPEDNSFNRTQANFTLADGTIELYNVYVKKIAAGNGSIFYYKFV